MMDIKSILETLCNATIVSGYESSTNDSILHFLNELGINAEVDPIGNIIFKKNGYGDKSLMIVAHYDEIGFSVKYIDDNGFIFISPAGGVDLTILRGQQVVINHNGEFIYGVIGTQPIHFTAQNRNNKAIEISDVWVDIGTLNEPTNIKGKVSIGDPISFAPNIATLCDNLITSKSMDNRCGVTALIYLFLKIQEEIITNYKSIYFVASSQEEVGLRGITVAGYNIKPDICIVLDMTHATDYPYVSKKKHGDIKLNEGAVIPTGSNFNLSLQLKLKKVAHDNNIKYQLDTIPCHSGTDTATIQLVRGGCISGLISIPCRYMHTPTEIVSIDDIKSAVEILSNFVSLKK